MASAPRPLLGLPGHARWMRVAGAVALVAYGTALGAPSAGHGFRLAAHLVAEHHEAFEALAFGPGDAAQPAHTEAEPSGRSGSEHEGTHEHDEVEDRDGPPHEHDAAHEHSGADEHATVSEQREAPGTGDHSHEGRVHSHREEPPPPALLTVSVDKHCVPARCVVPAPLPARGADAVTPAAAHVPVVLPVERRPPQRRA